jgi:hypothetical protein
MSYHAAARRRFMFMVCFLTALSVCCFTTDKSGATALPSAISSSTVLSAEGNPYTGSATRISSKATLTLKPGVVIKLTSGLTIDGTLNAEGTAEKPVTFTSIKDDSVGGDTNGDGSATTPAPGDWAGIEFTEGSGASGTSLLVHTNIAYGGQASYPNNAMVEIRCPCANPPELIDSYIGHSYTRGVEVRRGDPVLAGNTVESNAEAGIEVLSGAPEIRENTIVDNARGIYFSVGKKEHGTVDINENYVAENKSAGIHVSAPSGTNYIDAASLGENVVANNGERAIIYDVFPNSTETVTLASDPVPSNITTNLLSGNQKNGIWVAGAIRASATWEDSNYPLVVFGGGITINVGLTLTLGAGVVVKLDQQEIYANGQIASEGTAESPVTLTSIKDDSIAGDTNGDKFTTVPAPGDWASISFPEAKNVKLDYVDFRYARAALAVDILSTLTVSHSDFVHNEAAITVVQTAENSPELASLPCVFPYLSVVLTQDDWFGPTGAPAPDIDIASVVGAVIPVKYSSMLAAATSLAPISAPLYGQENTIPFAVYSCSAAGIPPIAVTPVIASETPISPHFP